MKFSEIRKDSFYLIEFCGQEFKGKFLGYFEGYKAIQFAVFWVDDDWDLFHIREECILSLISAEVALN